MDARGEIIAKIEIQRDHLTWGEINDLTDDRDDPSLKSSGARYIGEVFPKIKMLVIAGGKTFQEEDAEVWGCRFGFVLGDLKSQP